MHLDFITPDQTIFEGEVTIATLPGTDGSFQVLNGHAPLISSLGKGELNYRTKTGDFHQYTIEGGVVEVLNNRVSVLAEKIIEE